MEQIRDGSRNRIDNYFFLFNSETYFIKIYLKGQYVGKLYKM